MPSTNPIAFPEQIARARASGYSDAEIASHLSPKAPEKFKAAADAGYSPTEILNHLGTAPDAPVTAPGVAKSVGAGLLEGASSLAGLPGDLSKGVDWLFDKATGPITDPEAKAALERARSMGPPTSAAISHVADSAGLIHKPDNSTERHVQNITSFIPASLGGPEALAVNMLKRGVLPGAVSEAAGTAAQGTPLEIPARLAGALVSTSGIKSAVGPTSEQLLSQGSQGFKDFRTAGFTVDPNKVDQWSKTTAAYLQHPERNFTSRTAPETNRILEGLQGGSMPVTAAQLDEAKTLLKGVQSSGGLHDPTAASVALSKLDELIGSTPGAKLWQDAKGNYAAGKRAEAIADAATAAQLSADAANSGHNTGNATRQSFKRVLLSDSSRGFNAAELAQVEKIVRGTTPGNIMRSASNALGGGGGIGQGVAMAAGGVAGSQSEMPGGFAEGALMPLIAGTLLRRAANASVSRQVGKLDQMVRERSPMANANAIIQPQGTRGNMPWVRRMLSALAAMRAGQPQ